MVVSDFMIAVIIIILAFVVVSASLANGHWEVAVLFCSIAILLLLMGAGERKDVRAWLNWRDYWYDGTHPGRNKNVIIRHNAKPCKVSERELDEAAEKRNAYMKSARSGRQTISKSGQAVVCHYCGRMVRAASDTAYTSEGRMRIYRCPECGRQNMTKI